jgi:hypothetical protein
MSVNILKMTRKKWKHLGTQGCSPDHPLVVVPAAVVVRAIELGAWDFFDEPLKQLFMPHVHAKRYLRMKPISSEMTFPYEDP